MDANKYDGHSGRSGVVFIRDNVYQKIAYISLLKFKNPEEKIDVLTKENILDARNSYSKVYVICDYLFYSSHCICGRTNDNFVYILDEDNNGISSIPPEKLNRAAHHWLLHRSTSFKLACMYCEKMKQMTSNERDMINTIRMMNANDDDIQNSVLKLLGINNKAYSRITLQLLRRLRLKRIHALVLWCHNQSLTPF